MGNPNGNDAALDARSITVEFAKSLAESEFEKYRIIQDRLFQSYFDRFENDTLPLIALGLE